MGNTTKKEEVCALVQRAKQADTHAFALLYEMVYEDLYRMALYTLGNHEDAEDMVSETVLDAYVGIKALKDETAFRGWIFKILSNKCKKKIAEYMKTRENISMVPLDDMENNI
nr:RNA polymerase sigma factor [Lachnospiraceae bacterium]